MLLLPILPLLLISAYHAWRYAQTDIDPDWSLFNMAAFTGSWYGRDFIDCKTPGVHLWYWGLAKLVGADIARVRFLHHLLLGLVSVPIYLLTGSFWDALIYAVLINAGWLWTFHGNVGQVPAALVTLALILPHQPWVAAPLVALAVAFEPKLLLPFVALVYLYNWWATSAVLVALALLLVYYLYSQQRQWWDWIWELSIEIPRRMTRRRVADKLYIWMPWFAAQGYLYVLPILGLAVYLKPDWRYWLPAVLYLGFIYLGMVVRPNHLIPLIPWIVAVGWTPALALAVLGLDFLSSGLYLGNLWFRFYYGLWDDNVAARKVGAWLRDKPGRLWVNGYHTGVYIHARKPVPFGMTEQAEMNTICVERRTAMVAAFKQDPPEWVVQGTNPGLNFKQAGYARVAEYKNYSIWKRNG